MFGRKKAKACTKGCSEAGKESVKSTKTTKSCNGCEKRTTKNCSK